MDLKEIRGIGLIQLGYGLLESRCEYLLHTASKKQIDTIETNISHTSSTVNLFKINLEMKRIFHILISLSSYH